MRKNDDKAEETKNNVHGSALFSLSRLSSDCGDVDIVRGPVGGARVVNLRIPWLQTQRDKAKSEPKADRLAPCRS